MNLHAANNSSRIFSVVQSGSDGLRENERMAKRRSMAEQAVEGQRKEFIRKFDPEADTPPSSLARCFALSLS
jgi:hypothetical protein